MEAKMQTGKQELMDKMDFLKHISGADKIAGSNLIEHLPFLA